MAYPEYDLVNRDGSKERCQVIYSPITTDYKGNPYKRPRAVIQIPRESGFDFREVPIDYLVTI